MCCCFCMMLQICAHSKIAKCLNQQNLSFTRDFTRAFFLANSSWNPNWKCMWEVVVTVNEIHQCRVNVMKRIKLISSETGLRETNLTHAQRTCYVSKLLLSKLSVVHYSGDLPSIYNKLSWGSVWYCVNKPYLLKFRVSKTLWDTSSVYG